MENMQVNEQGGEKIARKKFLAVVVACMAIPTPGVKGRVFELWVLNRWGSNFCVHFTPCEDAERRGKKSSFITR